MRKIVLLLCLLITVVPILHFKGVRQLKNTIDVANIDDVQITELNAIGYVKLPSQIDNGYALTPTGICFDKRTESYFVANYGKATKDDKNFNPSIVSFSKDFSKINFVLYLDNTDDIDIQGIAFDDLNSSLWYTDGNDVINCDSANGEEISRFSIGEFQKYKANGICINTEDNTLWVLCSSEYILHFDKNGTLLGAIKCDYLGQDHIFMDESGIILISAGIDYNGNDNYVIRMDQNANILEIFKVKDSYAIEGIAVIDGKLYVMNDGIYHNAKIEANYVQIYDIN